MAAALPLLHEMLQAALKPSCSKELELLCGGLVLLAGLLPPAFAGAVRRGGARVWGGYLL